MKVNLKITFDRYGEYVTGHIEDVEMYKDVKSGKKWWRDSYKRITHIRIPKETFERLLELDRVSDLNNVRTIDADVLWNNRPQIPKGYNEKWIQGFEYCLRMFSEQIKKQLEEDN